LFISRLALIKAMHSRISHKVLKQISQAIVILKQGGVIAFPTDTVYGLAANINIPEAVERIYRVKGRSYVKALPLIISRPSQLDEITGYISPTAKLLINRFWPGPFTIIVNKLKTIPDIVTSGNLTVAVRVSSHPVPAVLVDGLGNPVTGTSANLSGRPSPQKAEEVFSQLGSMVDMIIEDDEDVSGIESTIVDVSTDIIRIVRKGAIPAEVIEDILKIK
jgi:L-threonylcarbamoyladenylate synthase